MPTQLGMNPTVSPGKIGIVVSRYNENITNRLLAAAIDTLKKAGYDDSRQSIVWVPGAWEIPVVTQRLLSQPDILGVVTLGAVIRGETTHDVHINTSVSQALMQLSLASAKPVAFGVLTTNNLEQAINRAGGNVGNKGEEAANALLEVLEALRNI
jgi:6,7-dimethyl-8-ribityllumazine synthase